MKPSFAVMRWRGASAVCVGGLGVCLAAWTSAASLTPDDALTKFLAAPDVTAAETAVPDVVASGVTFDSAFARLRSGRVYSANVPRGIVHLSRKAGGKDFYYDLDVPENYDPARRYQVRFQLHGGVMGRATNEPRGNGSIGALAGAEQIYVIPYASAATPWWGDAQLDNLRAILDNVKRTYNVDENRVVLAGVSDGATASYYFAMRDTTPFASFLPLNGFILVLSNPDLHTGWDLFPNNLRNKPIFAVNGGMDPLYPMAVVEPYLNHLKKSGVTVDYHPRPEAAHNTRWWPEMKDAFETFVREHPRNPLPETLTWETTGAPRTRRAHWLVIDSVAVKGNHTLPDVNQFPEAGSDGRPSPMTELFRHPLPYGRVDLVRRGNAVEMTTEGVAQVTLLLSPDAFDFARPISVTANGRMVFDGLVQPSVATLMKWASLDNDRTMLFGAELQLSIK